MLNSPPVGAAGALLLLPLLLLLLLLLLLRLLCRLWQAAFAGVVTPAAAPAPQSHQQARAIPSAPTWQSHLLGRSAAGCPAARGSPTAPPAQPSTAALAALKGQGHCYRPGAAPAGCLWGAWLRDLR